MRANIAVAGVLLLASAGAVFAGPTVTYMGQSAAWGPTSNGGPFEFAPTGFGFDPGVGKNGAALPTSSASALREARTSVPGRITSHLTRRRSAGAWAEAIRTRSISKPHTSTRLSWQERWVAYVPTFTYGSFGSSPSSAVVASGDALQNVIWGIETELGARMDARRGP
jgi:hypothetical protein